jgi:maltokinase
MSEAVCVDVEARWFAGKDRAVSAVACADALGPLRLAGVSYADGGPGERYLLVPDDPGAWAGLLRELGGGGAGRAGGTGGAGVRGGVAGRAGRLELRRGPAFAALAPALEAGEAAVPSVDQTNTLVVLGRRLLVKAYRRLSPGAHPEVEVLEALAGSGAPVPAYAGSLHYVPHDGSEPTALALLQEFVPGAVTGWEAPVSAVADALRAGVAERAGSSADPVLDDRTGSALLPEYRALGQATAALHAELAAALPTRPATAADRAAWRAEAEETLSAAAAVDPAFAAAAGEVRARLAALEGGAGGSGASASGASGTRESGATGTRGGGASAGGAETPLLTRVHGDLHVAQFLRSGERLSVIDFEGDPTRPLASRRALDTPLRDLASLLRSIDHVGSAASRRVGWTPPDAWIAAARAAALAGYAERSAVPVDHALLHALELAKECGEAVYASRQLPEWAYVAPRGLRRLLALDPDHPDRNGPP